MKATVVGYRPYKMTDDDGRVNAGISLYLLSRNPSDPDIRGMVAGKYTLKSTSPDYQKLLDHQFIKPFESEVDVYVSPAGKSTVLGLTIGVEK